ncbi:hypothetical protein Nepgr_004299 [Nepenthes gracilis]|uniref:non-specific serine/threonine protein kinase n=1 Tax=Nepenthes gracilis TaxID=150966 RepID=A0AAD3XF20_NEPGR|nr:hypothetical protein Nepgr_004299 [Nepenthes gracilis]
MDEKTEEEYQQQIPVLDFDQFKVLCPLGRGAKGVVFHVRIKSTDEDLALKVVLKSSIKNKRGKNSGSNRICFEQQVLRRFHHPLLPRLRGVLETEMIVGYAIDYCPGRDLNALRREQSEKMFSDEIIRFYGAELVLALEYLHGLGIVYRDLKPENILIQENGHLMLVDFDLSTKLVPGSSRTRPTAGPSKKPEPPMKRRTSFAKTFNCFNSGISPEESVSSPRIEPESISFAESDPVGKSNSFVGTEEYVAPEIIMGTGHEFAVDWWCLGVVLYEMLYGTTPFKGSNRKETFYRILAQSPNLVGETTPLRDLIKKLLEKDPKQRISLEGIKGHDFFSGVDWNMILWLPRPPYIPVRPEMEEDTDGIKDIDVEPIVQEIFANGNVENDKGNNINGENLNEGVYIGLDQPPRSFLVF